jgi:hypothetical protein
MELDADLALELWDIFVVSIQLKEKSIVAESYINWLVDNNISDEDLEELARQDHYLGGVISTIKEDNELEDEEDTED